MTSNKNTDDHWSGHSAPSTKHNWTDPNKNSLDNDIEQFSKTAGGGGGCVLTVLSMMALPILVILIPLLLLQ